ncbi:MAG: ABC transporter permease [Candidatus Dormibacterales bacterium]
MSASVPATRLPRARRLLAGSIWGREMVELLQRPRALAVKLLFPAAVAAPLLFSAAPAFYAAMALTMLAGTMAALGSGAVLSRERAAGLTVRYLLLPSSPRRVCLERLAVAAGIDLFQFAPVLLLVLARRPGLAAWWPALVLATAGTLMAGNALGALASTLTTSPGEVMLYVLLPTLPGLYLAGVFTPFTDPVRTTISRLLPYSYLHQALMGALGGSAGMAPWQAGLGGLCFVLLGAAAAVALGRRLLEAP